MLTKKDSALVRRPEPQDPFGLFRQMTSELDRMFEGFGWPSFRTQPLVQGAAWLPEIEVFEKDNRLVTKVDLPGMKKQDVKVEVSDGQLTISGERKSEAEEKKERFYRSERQYGSFYRSVPLPEGVKLEDVKATFSDGVLEVSVPLPEKPKSTARTVEVEETSKPAA